MNIRSKNIALLFSCVLLSISCVDKYLPDSLDAFDRDVNFTTKLYRPQLGKNTLMSEHIVDHINGCIELGRSLGISHLVA